MSDYASGSLGRLIAFYVQENKKESQIIDQLLSSDVSDYQNYLQSSGWKEKSRAAKERAGWRCQLCNRAGNESSLNAHHRTYKNLGNEQEIDLIVLCRNCHSKFHDKEEMYVQY